ncbi:MAG: 2-phosphosulfolactate phosphatase [Bacteroidota bacterium]|nr:2-phosphosulfolactate phosphatase [Bacteroidota bacterium]
MDDDQKKIEVCFSPAVFDCFHNPDAIVIVVDVLRASTAICTAFMNDVGTIIPISSANEAREYKHKGYIVAAERDGHTLDFADFGNSPFNFTSERISGKTIAYSTTNGTQAINMASSCYKVAVGSFINLRAMSNWILNEKRDVIILCAGWKNRFSLEDTILAGAIAEKLLESKSYYTECDSAHASLDLWLLAKNDIIGYIQKAAQRTRLRKNGLDDVIEFCFTRDLTDIIPVYSHGMLVKLREPVAFVN